VFTRCGTGTSMHGLAAYGNVSMGSGLKAG